MKRSKALPWNAPWNGLERPGTAWNAQNRAFQGAFPKVIFQCHSRPKRQRRGRKSMVLSVRVDPLPPPRLAKDDSMNVSTLTIAVRLL